MTLKAPFPYFGGKSGAAELIWARFGNVPNYVEPFAGSLAVLLSRPTPPQTETCNDTDGHLSNAWRAIRADPDAVAFYADLGVSECDLHARHIALVHARSDLTARLMGNIEYYDAKLAGWWIHGACNWIGSGFCAGVGPWVLQGGLLVNRREVGELAAGISRKLPHLGDAGKGVSRKLPHLGNAGVGVSRQLPHLGDAGVGVSRQLPHLGDAGVGVDNPGLYAWMRDLSARLRRVRICCGDWTRVLGESVTTKHGLTSVLLDPPYDADDADNAVYGTAYDGGIAAQVRAWALENGSNPLLRIAVCSYGASPELAAAGWLAAPWKARKGYASVDEDGSHNGHREVIMFSPHCIQPDLHGPLFGGAL